MKSLRTSRLAWSACAWTLALATASAWADKPDFAGHPKWDKHERQGGHDRPGREYPPQDRQQAGERPAPSAAVSLSAGVGVFFADRHRRAVNDYFAPRVSAGRCPPGLAKKGNGCLPPGQAKKWVVGRPLPTDVVRYPVPAELRLSLGIPPQGYQYVRVASDILLIAIGTGMVIDAIEDLGGR